LPTLAARLTSGIIEFVHRVDADISPTGVAIADDGPDVEAPDASVVVSLTPLLLTIVQVSIVVGISERKLRGMVSSGQFPRPVKGLGRMSRWKQRDVEAWVASLA
jgi:predicted DNA-binding transcriptional regulator AlpA